MPKNTGVYYTRAADKAKVVLIFNPGSGFESEYSHGTQLVPAYDNQVSKAFDTGAFAEVTEAHAGAIKKSLAAVRAANG